MWKEIFLFSGFLMVLTLAYPAQDLAPIVPGAVLVHHDDADLETLSGAESAWGGYGGGWGHRGWGHGGWGHRGGWGGHHHHHHHHRGWGYGGGWGY